MALRVSLDWWTRQLLLGLGVFPLSACGGVAEVGTTTGGSGGAIQSGGNTASGATGGRQALGGNTASGGYTSVGGFPSRGGSGGSTSMGGFTGTGGGIICPPCVAPPDPRCVGTGPCGCGPYTCPAGGPYPCENPQPYMYGGNFIQCASGFLHREARGTCPSSLPRALTFSSGTGYDQCTSDANCTASPHGYCTSGPQIVMYYCAYGCVNDAECAPGQVCLCGDPVGQCVAATCGVDSDCGTGLLCASYEDNPYCGGTQFACQTPQDTCGGSVDCVGAACTIAFGATARTCSSGFCVIGRPFLVHGAERTALGRERADWRTAGAPIQDVASLGAELRRRLANEWTHIALMEHASIAAFARFTLQLLSLGAPAELVEASNRAQADETRHARLCFSVASQYGGRPMGPAALRIDGSLEEQSLEGIVVNAIREGCIGETLASVEAAEASAHVVDPVLREILATISADEMRHAELAWQFVRWALESGGEGVREAVRCEFGQALQAPSSRQAQGRSEELELLEHGVLTPALRQALRERVLVEVVDPCAGALIEASAAAAA